ncbi:MAG TPA: hypothetical protein VHA54_05865 [Solirubrobacterales bacterium]|nr:hypothetical protein [Solirubrobacterales bacterium]
MDTAILAPRFAVFRGPRTDVDGLPPGMLPPPVVASLGLDLSASRYTRQVDGSPAFLVPSAEFVCLYTDNEAIGSCWQPQIVRNGQAVATGICGPGLDSEHIVSFGLVPDGVSEVTVLRTNVPSVTVPVEGNVFVARTSSSPPLPLKVSWIEDGKRVVRSSGIPPKVARRGCGGGRPSG